MHRLDDDFFVFEELLKDDYRVYCDEADAGANVGEGDEDAHPGGAAEVAVGQGLPHRASIILILLPSTLKFIELVLVDEFMHKLIFFGVNSLDSLHGLWLVIIHQTILNRFLPIIKCVEQDDGGLYWDLDAVNAPPPLRRLKRLSILGHADSHEEEHEVEELHQDVGRRSKSLINQVHWNSLFEDF